MNHDIVMRSIKIIDIGYITALYFIAGYYAAILLDTVFNKYFGNAETNKTYSKTKLIVYIIIEIAIIGIISYILRNLIQMIPFPLDHYNGFDHMKVKEVSSGTLLTVTMILFQSNVQNKIIYLKTLM